MQQWYGQNWSLSLSVPDVSFELSSLSGNNGLIVQRNYLETNCVTYYTIDGGKTWTPGLTISGTFNTSSVSVYGDKGIIGSSQGIYYYTSPPICYDQNTLILVLKNNQEVYIPMKELKIGDMVKTYKNGNKKVKLLHRFNYNYTNETNPLHCLYKMKYHNVIVTGRHSILVDNLTLGEYMMNMKYNFREKIEDKKLLLACSSDQFEKVKENREYNLIHFVLENEDIYKHYGVYINDEILSESCSEYTVIKKSQE